MTDRVLLIAAAGVALGGYGAVLLWENPLGDHLRIAVWALRRRRRCTTSCSRRCARRWDSRDGG